VTDVLVDDERVHDLPTSCSLVYLVLDEADRPLTHREITTRAPTITGRTVHRALSQLRRADVVSVSVDQDDPRTHRYALVERRDVLE
jgi:DNA-binding HxlR family transcriptional regulator